MLNQRLLVYVNFILASLVRLSTKQQTLMQNIEILQNTQMQGQNHNYDVVVVGAGVFGLSTVLFLSTHYPQLRVALVEQYKMGHGQGSSHSQIRIIRSVYANVFYRDLCVQAIKTTWPEVQQLLDDKFIQSNPYIMFLEPQHLFRQIQPNISTSNGQLQLISTEQAKNRFGTLPNISNPHWAVYDSKAGVVMAHNYMSKMQQFLKTCPQVTIYQQTELLGYTNTQAGVVLTVKNKQRTWQLKSNKLALSCGRWITKVVPKLQGLLQEVRQTVTFWQMKQPQNYALGKFPCWLHQRIDGTKYYCLPAANQDGLKFGLHSEDPLEYSRFSKEQAYLDYITQLCNKRAQEYFGTDLVGLAKVEKCYFTNSKDDNFIIDWTDQHHNVLAVSPCSGHGFKFAPIVGQIVADLVVKDESIGVFEINREMVSVEYHMGLQV